MRAAAVCRVAAAFGVASCVVASAPTTAYAAWPRLLPRVHVAVARNAATTPPPAASGHGADRDPGTTPGQAVASRIEVLVLEGSQGSGGIAPSVANIPQLHRPPFSAFTQIVERARTTLPLGPSPATVQLPGGSATVTSTGRGADGRYTVVVQVTRNGHTHSIHFAATPGDPFYTVSETGASNALILGFTVR